MRVADFRAERILGDFKDTASDRLGASVGMEHDDDGPTVAMNVFGGVAVSITFTHTVGFNAAKYSAAWRTSSSDVAFAIGTHARVVLARARLVVRHLPDQVLGGHAGEVGGFRMALAGHQMARAARKSAGPGRLRPMAARRDVHRETSPADSRSRRPWPHSYSLALPGARTMPSRPHGGRLDLVGDVECPVGESLGDCERFLRVELPRHEERSEGAHEDGDADGRIRSAGSRLVSPLPDLFLTNVSVVPDEFWIVSCRQEDSGACEGRKTRFQLADASTSHPSKRSIGLQRIWPGLPGHAETADRRGGLLTPFACAVSATRIGGTHGLSAQPTPLRATCTSRR